jgi:hypothetical protein
MRYLLIWSLLLFISFVAADPNVHSSQRIQEESVEEAIAKYEGRLAQAGVIYTNEPTVLSVRKSLSEVDYSNAPQWESYEQVKKVFEQIRDARFIYTHESGPNIFPRRSSWLYPADGCFARAALASQNAALWGNPRPAKIFVFGDLEVKTKNSTSGSVSWWYHVAPIVAVGKEYYILDPSIDSSRPLTLNEWCSTMTDDLSSLQATVSNPYTYVPRSIVENTNKLEDVKALRDQHIFLRFEWRNLESLERNPQEELGENPPWQK